MVSEKMDYVWRIEALKQKTIENSLDAFVVGSKLNQMYFTSVGLAPMERKVFFIVYSDERQPTFVIPKLDLGYAKKAKHLNDFTVYSEHAAYPGEGWSDKLREVLDGCSRIGLDIYTPAEVLNYLKDKEVEILPLVEEIKIVKAEDEAKMIQAAAEYSKFGLEQLLDKVEYGTKVFEVMGVNSLIMNKMYTDTAGNLDLMSTSVIVLAQPGVISSDGHGIPHAMDEFRDGPNIGVIALKFNGYNAEAERTFFLEEPTEKMKFYFNHMMEARRRAFALLAPGVKCSDIENAANGYLKEQGLGDYISHRTGHGFGFMGAAQFTREAPWISEGSEDVLQENMFISIEPGLYVPNLGGFRHSDTVMITSNGYVNLTESPDTIEELTFIKKGENNGK